jgi:hypothetical protein
VRKWLLLSLALMVGCEGDARLVQGAGGDDATTTGGAGGLDLLDQGVQSLFDQGARPPTVLDAGPEGRAPRICGEREICDNGRDDDCDGLVDEGCACQQAAQACYSGDPRDLEAGGACRAGVQSCMLELYGPCEGEVRPQAEVCNGLDDNCDGQVDEGTDCANPAPIAVCPPDQVGAPLAEYPLEGGYEDPDGEAMARATWRLIESPAGATGRPMPADALRSELFADLQGVYVLELEVEDAGGSIGRCQTRISAEQSDDHLRIELVWNAGAAQDASDVDLHLLRTSRGTWHGDASNGDDCHWRNCSVCGNEGVSGEAACRSHLADLNRGAGPQAQVTWSEPRNDDDPRLDLDDVEGQGPENINIRRPRDGNYRVGVHYWDDEGFGDSTVTVRIFCGGVLARAYPPVVLRAQGANGDDDTEFWAVADVAWQGAGCEVHDLGPVACPRICSNGEAERGGCPSGQSRGQRCP